MSLHINSRTFLSKVVVHISSQDRNKCETIAIPLKVYPQKWRPFSKQGSFLKAYIRRTECRYSPFDRFQQISNVLQIIYICLFVYNVYFLCRHMKFNLVRHFICLKTKMTEFGVGCFHIIFFQKQMKVTYFKGVKYCASS